MDVEFSEEELSAALQGSSGISSSVDYLQALGRAPSSEAAAAADQAAASADEIEAPPLPGVDSVEQAAADDTSASDVGAAAAVAATDGAAAGGSDAAVPAEGVKDVDAQDVPKSEASDVPTAAAADISDGLTVAEIDVELMDADAVSSDAAKQRETSEAAVGAASLSKDSSTALPADAPSAEDVQDADAATAAAKDEPPAPELDEAATSTAAERMAPAGEPQAVAAEPPAEQLPAADDTSASVQPPTAAAAELAAKDQIVDAITDGTVSNLLDESVREMTDAMAVKGRDTAVASPSAADPAAKPTPPQQNQASPPPAQRLATPPDLASSDYSFSFDSDSPTSAATDRSSASPFSSPAPASPLMPAIPEELAETAAAAAAASGKPLPRKPASPTSTGVGLQSPESSASSFSVGSEDDVDFDAEMEVDASGGGKAAGTAGGGGYQTMTITTELPSIGEDDDELADFNPNDYAVPPLRQTTADIEAAAEAARLAKRMAPAALVDTSPASVRAYVHQVMCLFKQDMPQELLVGQDPLSVDVFVQVSDLNLNCCILERSGPAVGECLCTGQRIELLHLERCASE